MQIIERDVVIRLQRTQNMQEGSLTCRIGAQAEEDIAVRRGKRSRWADGGLVEALGHYCRRLRMKADKGLTDGEGVFAAGVAYRGGDLEVELGGKRAVK